MKKIINPILTGFNPDPSIIRVEEDYYIATSTFEWFPGVQIHHSQDLINWNVITHPVGEKQIDMIGDPDSGGVWAPCLSYDNGVYYLVYTDVISHMGPYKDTHNYLISATDIMGPWSDPVYLNSSGFDPSLFHDDDGKKWILNMIWDHRKNKNSFAGIVMQEYSEREKSLVGPIYNIFKGTELGLTEGPHIYKHNGYYYLMTAEGGTRWEHAITVARSTQLTGPYEVDPQSPMLTSAYKPELELQKAGHGSLITTPNNELYLVHLCGRPVKPSGNCILGRETAIQLCEWTEEGWLRLAKGGNDPQVTIAAPPSPEYRIHSTAGRVDFSVDQLPIEFQSLREPQYEGWLSLKDRPGFLRLKGRESLYSTQRQSLIARRQQAFSVEVETVMEYEPECFQQMAGLIYYYNTKNYHYLFVSYDEEFGKYLGIMSSNRGVYEEPIQDWVSLEEHKSIYLKADIHHEEMRFSISTDGQQWDEVAPTLDASIISDENAELVKDGVALDQGFTGAFVGLCAQDLSGRKKHADFNYFQYRER
ncbi:glycoside hydrolase family 43 protein [Halalkalibacter sp. APA_J-10(15)]|uniref:glycoside hydrolase family 43 protein n=1 Tax=Halalkalibacter sp. APA_J-10(15) TaxID=2933805 RepID=UPI001FF4A3DD|nr:glycoside hydrolase family 43 protein [Halalkalibacter sp. APA_J-10(15)]MCK0469966.1 glycoside hydrolase family 43 protein [Halalkalibacter sp. APA_J-10(15)]